MEHLADPAQQRLHRVGLRQEPRARGSDQLAPGPRRLLDDPGASYLLGYEPSDAKRDGRFRSAAGVTVFRDADFSVD